MSVVGVRNSNKTTITFKNTDGSVAGTLSISKAAKTKGKRLNYNFKQISAMIMRTTNSLSAKQVVSKARSKTAMLRRNLKSSQYDEEEVANAIIHAQQMERIAKKRMKHLQEEEMARPQGGACQAELEEENDQLPFDAEDAFGMDSEELRRLMQELEREMQKAMEESQDTNGLEELTEVVKKDMDPGDLELLKKKHRSEELRDIMEADMKYLKAVFEKLAREKQEASSGVSLQLGGVEMPVMAAAPAPDAATVVMEGSCIDTTV